MTPPPTPALPTHDPAPEPVVLALRLPAEADDRPARPPRDLPAADELQKWLDLSG
jgi:hypothetical protein